MKGSYNNSKYTNTHGHIDRVRDNGSNETNTSKTSTSNGWDNNVNHHEHIADRNGIIKSKNKELPHPLKNFFDFQFPNNLNRSSNGSVYSAHATGDSFALSNSQGDYRGLSNLKHLPKTEEKSYLLKASTKKSKTNSSTQKKKKQKTNSETDARDSQWMSQYDALKDFYLQFGHANVPMHFSSNKRLGHWINNQRQLYRKYKAGMSSSMTEKRIKLLEELDFAWVLGKDWSRKQKQGRPNSKDMHKLCASQKEKWHNSYDEPNYQSLNTPKDQVDTSHSSVLTTERKPKLNLEANVPFRKRRNYHEMNITLQHHELSTASSHDSLFKGEVQMKQSKELTYGDTANCFIGGTLSPTPPTQQTVVSHDDSPSSVLQTSSSSSSTSEYSPVCDQTSSKIENNLSMASKILNNNNNVHKFEAIKTKDTYNSQNIKSTELQWQNHIKDLIEFKQNFGHCNVPFQFNEKKSLGYWVHNQRQVYKKWLKGEPCSLTQSRIDSLKELGLNLNSPKLLRKGSGNSISKNESFHSSNASICAYNSPSVKAEALKQPKTKNKIQTSSGKISCAPIKVETPSTFHIVNETNNKVVNIDAFDTLWNLRFTELQQFYASNGHSDVPVNYLENMPLGVWAMNQRQQYRKLKNGKKTSLTPDRITALESLGFRWLVGKGVRVNNKRKIVDDDDTSEESNFFALTDDLICMVLSFLPSLKGIFSFCMSSKRVSKLLNTYQMEQLCQRLYVTKFGMDGINLEKHSFSPYFWRNEWHNIYCLRRGLKNQGIIDEILTEDQDNKNKMGTIGILSQAQEKQALFNDNPSATPSNTEKYCLGYFGMLKFNVRVNANMKVHDQEMLAVWGDFNGLRIIDGHSLYTEDYVNSNNFQSVADKNFGQILTAVAAPVTAPEKPCLYLGSASGAVLSVTARFCPNTMSVKFDIASASFAHTDEVTCLTWLMVPGTDLFSTGIHLVSGGCDGMVFVYLDSSSFDGHVDLNRRAICCSESVPILSLACCSSQFCVDALPILITGDAEGNVKLWKKDDSFIGERKAIFVPIQVYPSQDICRITKLKVVRNKYLVSGDTSGNVRVWNILNEVIDHSPRLSILFKIPVADRGGVEQIDVVGNILLTSGGNDGFVRGWDLKYGDLIGSVLCHKGRFPQQRYSNSINKLRSSVVGLFFTGFKSFVTLCRDGCLQQFNYGDVSEKKLDFIMQQMSRDFANSDIEGGVVPAAAVLANLGGKSTSSLLIPHSNPSACIFGFQSLKQIMTCYGNRQPTEIQKMSKDNMRLSIIKAAYEHASNPEWKRFPETPFIGADGRVYKYVKKAFATFSGMHPCISCQRKNNGAYYCRLQLKHDSPNSYNRGCNFNILQYGTNVSSMVPSGIVEHLLESTNEHTDEGGSKDTIMISTKPANEVSVWKCHKCGRQVTAKNKRCPICCSWRGGKRKKSEPSCETCRFCHYTFTIDGRCTMCHMKTVAKKTRMTEQKVKECKIKYPRKANHVESPMNDTHSDWQCHKCSRINNALSKRCKCNAWKGGRRQLYIKQKKAEGKKLCSSDER